MRSVCCGVAQAEEEEEDWEGEDGEGEGGGDSLDSILEVCTARHVKKPEP